MRLDIPAKVTLLCFVLSLGIRVAIWIIVLTGGKESTGNQIIELLVVIAGNVIILSLYYFTLEMAVTKLILKSESIQDFKQVMRKHRCKQVVLLLSCLVLQVLQAIIVQVKIVHRREGYSEYSTELTALNYAVRLTKMALDAYMIGLFLSLFRFYVRAKKNKQIAHQLTNFQRSMGIFTLTVCALTFYRQLFVCVVGILTMIPSLDSTIGLQGYLFMNKHIVIPMIDLVTGSGLLYMFYILSRKTMPQAPDRQVLLLRKERNVEDLNRILSPEYVASTVSQKLTQDSKRAATQRHLLRSSSSSETMRNTHRFQRAIRMTMLRRKSAQTA